MLSVEQVNISFPLIVAVGGVASPVTVTVSIAEQPLLLSVTVTEYSPDAVTLIVDVVAPVLHK